MGNISGFMAEVRIHWRAVLCGVLGVLAVVGLSLTGLTQTGGIEDAALETRKLLKAADQLETLTHRMETLQLEIAQLKKDLEIVQSENKSLRAELSAMKEKAAREQDALIEEVGKIVAESSGAATNAAAERGKGYEHVVLKGQSLWAIARAFQKEGVNVSVDDIRKANNLSNDDLLKVGQKLFIPHN